MSHKLGNEDRKFKYDVGLSFAGEQRYYVSEVADRLKRLGIRVFYDDYEKPELWGKDLYEHLDNVYQYQCKYCVLFASREYAEKVWPTKERRSAQARALEEKHEYILPVRFDSTIIPGLPKTVFYLEAAHVEPCDVADLLRKKLGKPERENYLPPMPNRLFEQLDIDVDDDPEALESILNSAYQFLAELEKTTTDERIVISSVFLCGCPAEMPENIHINIDLLRRETNMKIPQLKEILGGIKSLGFMCTVGQLGSEEEHEGRKELGHSGEIVYVEWHNFSTKFDHYYPPMYVADKMITTLARHYCRNCTLSALKRLDFSQLSSVEE